MDGDAPACANQAYNVTNGDFIRWENLWPRFAEYFGMQAGPVKTVRLAQAMADKAPVWERIVARHGLQSCAVRADRIMVVRGFRVHPRL